MKTNKFEESKVQELAEVDDWSSAWKECQEKGSILVQHS